MGRYCFHSCLSGAIPSHLPIWGPPSPGPIITWGSTSDPDPPSHTHGDLDLFKLVHFGKRAVRLPLKGLLVCYAFAQYIARSLQPESNNALQFSLCCCQNGPITSIHTSFILSSWIYFGNLKSHFRQITKFYISIQFNCFCDPCATGMVGL